MEQHQELCVENTYACCSKTVAQKSRLFPTSRASQIFALHGLLLHTEGGIVSLLPEGIQSSVFAMHDWKVEPLL
jgi:hypothetical protein